LLTFLDEWVAKVSGSDGVPVDKIQEVQIVIEVCVSSSGILARKGLAYTLRLCPLDDLMEISP
jgi:hypothetical protein